MFLSHAKALLVKATKASFTDAGFPYQEFSALNITLEYPIAAQAYPACWVDFDLIGSLRPVGIGYAEFAGDPKHEYRRWSFAGNATWTIVAMGSLERDRIFDAMVSTIAFGDIDPAYGNFRDTIQTDSLIALQPNFHEVEMQGFSAQPGTPWGTDEILYECTVSMQCVGEFVSAPGVATIVPLSDVSVVNWVTDEETDPIPTGEWIQ